MTGMDAGARIVAARVDMKDGAPGAQSSQLPLAPVFRLLSTVSTGPKAQPKPHQQQSLW